MASGLRLFLILLFLLPGPARAWPPTFGTEFNFSNQTIQRDWRTRMKNLKKGASQVPGNAEKSHAKQFADRLKQEFGDDCFVRPHSGKFSATEYEVRFKDGFGFNISVDPGVVEIQTLPETSAQITANVDKYQKRIFEIATKTGMDPHALRHIEAETAHLNIGVKSAFDKDPRAFSRLVADYSNRPSLALSILGRDLENAPPMKVLQPSQQAIFQKIVADAEMGNTRTVDAFADQMNHLVYTETPYIEKIRESTPRHYQAVGMKHLDPEDLIHGDLPFEFRAIRQPRTAEEYALVTRLFQKRIEHLKASTAPIYYRVAHSPFPLEPTSLESAAHFKIYVTEMGEDWKTYEKLLPQKLISRIESGEVDRILEGRIRWENGREFEDFRKIMVENYHLSPWMEHRLTEILSRPELPQHVAQTVLSDLTRLSKGSAEEAISAHRMMIALQEKGAFRQNAEVRERASQAAKEMEKLYVSEGCDQSHFLRRLFKM